jgi:hypothetical protein
MVVAATIALNPASRTHLAVEFASSGKERVPHLAINPPLALRSNR